MEIPALTDEELVDVLAAWRRQASWAQAGELAAVAELARRRESGSSRGEFASAEVGLALVISPRSADAHLDLARALTDRLPLTREALAEGRIDLTKVRVIVQGTRAVDAETARAVERRVLPDAGDVTPGRLRARVQRVVIALDPSGAEKRREASEAERHIDCYDTGNGTAVFGGVHLPAGPAIAADNRLHAIAKALKADGDVRTLDQLSADVFLSLLLGTHPASGLPTTELTAALAEAALDAAGARSAGDGARGPGESGAVASRVESVDRRSERGEVGRSSVADAGAGALALERAVGDQVGTVHLTVPLATMLGLSAEPGQAAGYGPLTAEVARQMAAVASSPATRWCVTVTGADGEPLHHGHLNYRPPAAMAHVVRALQPTCRFPGCTRPSRDCDLDHRVPYEQGGATCPCNLQPLCRRHHRTKAAKGWTVTQSADRLAWTTPAGKTYRTEPERPSSAAARRSIRRSPVETGWQRCLGSSVEAGWQRCVLDLPRSHRSSMPLLR
ncbi:HNH endonuclease signature motif containing protein [Actinomadura sp. DC4]|uniref:HNH endonuclease signature motif containing protein n=1 Tax=Actinomadura sp. DC4 TaxID=3055069 RepID=UPI0025B22B2F|nr:HNH endonuclease signature motif containing protein [Actinomadura sp. DC4]MDN3353966.1 DUF222 domain-containing protein [Actinomadura sp. DC4]